MQFQRPSMVRTPSRRAGRNLTRLEMEAIVGHRPGMRMRRHDVASTRTDAKRAVAKRGGSQLGSVIALSLVFAMGMGVWTHLASTLTF